MSQDNSQRKALPRHPQYSSSTMNGGAQQLWRGCLLGKVSNRKGEDTLTADAVEQDHEVTAEWEYAARAGSTTKYSWGDEISCSQACFGRRPALECSNSMDGTLPVGSFAANRFGLYDMHGNVREWVQDCWNDSYAGAPSNGSAWTRGDCSRRVLRGGSWNNKPRNLRSANRNRNTATNRNNLEYAGPT